MKYEVIARWESKTGKHWAELYHDGIAAFYRGEGCGGNMGVCSIDTAITQLQAKVDSGYFLPYSAKTPMRRIK